jgi:hypothetical protein
MTARNFFIFQAILSLGFGIPLLLVPLMLTSVYVASLPDTTGIVETLSRGYGTLLIAVGILSYMMRNVKSSSAKYAFFVSVFIGNLLVTIVHIRAIIIGFENSAGWSTALLTAIAAAWAGLLMTKEKEQISEE